MTSEKKMQIVIDNYFKSECNVDTSIRDAFEKGFRIGVQKTVHRQKGEWVRHELWGNPWFTCSECNYHGRNDFNFCPYCGARMKGGAE